MFQLLVLTIALLLITSPNASAQYSPPPQPTGGIPGTVPGGAAQSPFAVQIPPGQQTLPTGVMPQQVPNLQQGQGYVPMALPPSSGGFNPNTNQPSYNPYNMPSTSPAQPSAPTRSEVILYNPKTELKTVLVVKTSEGEFKIALKPDIAPKNVENFIDLALGQKEFVDVRTGKKVKRPFYTGLNCHRVLKSVLIQCGCPFGNGTGGPGFRVPDERSSGIRFDRPGVVAMALGRATTATGLGYEPNSAGSQFFISLAPLPEFNGQFTVVGQITSGMDTIRKIAESPTGPTDRPLKRVIIFSIDPDLPPLAPLAPVVDPMAPSAPTAPTDTPAPPVLPSGTIDPFAAPPPPNP